MQYYQILSGKTLVLLSLLLGAGGCTLTVTHVFDRPPVVVNNYYSSGTDGVNNTPENNTLSTSGLGVGYDLVRADPEDWTENSVISVGTRPKVFRFTPDPDPNATIDIPKLDRDAIRRRKPLGVNAETNAQFKWDDQLNFFSSATDFQESHGSSFSAGGGAMGVAFSASASFDNTQRKTTADAKTVATKNGYFRGLKMDIDFTVPQEFTQQFSASVRNLDDNPANYDTFIKNWGTHFSKSATIGAKCAYRLEFSNSSIGSRYGSSNEFEAEVSGGVAGVSLEAGGGYNSDEEQSVQEDTGAESINFVSYGGSGAATTSFSAWTEDAVDNPTMIDAYLLPYDTLFSRQFFPDDEQIGRKKAAFQAALARHYQRAQEIVDRLPRPGPIQFGQQISPQTFRITLKYVYVKQGYKQETGARNYGGILRIGVYGTANRMIRDMWVWNLNGGSPNFVSLSPGARHYPSDALKDFTVTLSPNQLEDAFVTITGNMTQTFKDPFTEKINGMGSKIADDVVHGESISLNAMKLHDIKDTNVTYTNLDPSEGDIVEIYFEAERIE